MEPLLFAQIENWMLFAGVSLMVVIMLRRYWRYYGKLKRKNRQEERARSTLKRDGVAHSPLLDAPPETLRWQVEMHDTARELKAELDTKIGVLQTLVRMADERIAQLSIATERQRTATAPPGHVREHVHPSGPPGNESLRRSVFELADRGWDARAIAAEIERPVGDVEMILSLRSTS